MMIVIEGDFEHVPKLSRKEPLPKVMSAEFWKACTAHLDEAFRDGVRTENIADATFAYRAAGIEPRPEWAAEMTEIMARCVRRMT